MVVLWILLGIILLVVFLLAVPLAVGYVRREESAPMRLEFIWLFGIVHVNLIGRQGGKADTAQQEKKDAQKTDKAKDAAQKKKKRFSLPPDVMGIARRILRLMKQTIRSFELSIHGDLFFGLPDPADTGSVWGMSLPFITWIEQRTDVHIHPHFHGSRADLIGRARVAVIPLRIVIPVITFILSPQGRALMRSARKGA